MIRKLLARMKIKPNWFDISVLFIGFILVAGFGYYFSAAYAVDHNISQIFTNLETIMQDPWKNYYNADTIKVEAFLMGFYFLLIFVYLTRRKNLMPGKEYGTARFEKPEVVTARFGDEEEYNNRILSKNVKVSLNTRKTRLNNNVLIIGGSGAGKTFFEVKPNLMTLPKSSFVVTDPKGEIVRSCGDMLKKNGYRVKVLNLIEMDKSDRYNPFAYIRNENDIVKLVTNIISNTTPKGASSNDPFWDRAEGLFLQSLFLYVWSFMPKDRQNFGAVMTLLSFAEATDGKKISKLTQMMNDKEREFGPNHPAIKQYKKCMRGAGDTVRSIIVSANSRLAYLENKKVLSMLAADDMNLSDIGIGVNGDGYTKTALFCVIPDSDKSYNFIVGMLYTQIFQELYYQADFNYGGRLPIHVTFMLDEFANVALPDDFCSLLSTMRSREISSVIIIQNLAQIKSLFKDTWETITGNCDSLVYLGGNEQSTHKYISELLGKGTIDKSSHSETRSRNGSSSRNYDVIGRELMTSDETRKMKNNKCLVFIRGMDPVIDEKYVPMEHPGFYQTSDGGAAEYTHQPVRYNEHGSLQFEILSKDAYQHLKDQEKLGEVKVNEIKLSYDKLMRLNEPDPNMMVEKQDDSDEDESSGESEKTADKEKTPSKTRLYEVISKNEYSAEQKQELRNAMQAKLSEQEILEFYIPSKTAEEMREYIRMHAGK